MSSYQIGHIAGGVVLVVLITRMALWLTKSWTAGGLVRIALAHVICALTIGVLGAHSIGVPPFAAFAMYAPIQAVVLIVDIILQAQRTLIAWKNSVPGAEADPAPAAPSSSEERGQP